MQWAETAVLTRSDEIHWWLILIPAQNVFLGNSWNLKRTSVNPPSTTSMAPPSPCHPSIEIMKKNYSTLFRSFCVILFSLKVRKNAPVIPPFKVQLVRTFVRMSCPVMTLTAGHIHTLAYWVGNESAAGRIFTLAHKLEKNGKKQENTYM